MEGKLVRTALGQVATLGALYDARSDSFCGINLLKKVPPASAVQVTDSHFTDSQFILSDTFTEKFHKLDIKAELKLSVLAGLFSLEGAGQYLKDEKSSARAIRSTLLYSIRTKVEQLNLYNDELKAWISVDALQHEPATHVLIEVTWGANSVVSVEYTNTEARDVKQIEGNLSAAMNQVAFSISGKGDAKFKEGGSSAGTQYCFKMYGDVLPINQSIPQTFPEALALMKKMPTLVQSANRGKGKPMTYALLPISVVRKYMKLEALSVGILRKVEEAAILAFVAVFDEILTTKQLLNDLYNDVRAFDYCVKDEDLKLISRTRLSFENGESKLRAELAKSLVEVRSGKVPATTIEALRTKYIGQDFSPDKIRKVLDQYTEAKEEITFARLMKNCGVSYVGRGGSLESIILGSGNADMYVLYYSKEFATKYPNSWKSTRLYFLNLAQEHHDFQGSKAPSAKAIFAFVNGEFNPKLLVGKSPGYISMLKNGKTLTTNVIKYRKDEATLCFVQSNTTLRPCAVPTRGVPLVIRCPASISGTCPNNTLKWVCHKCRDPITYGLNANFYCACGTGLYNTFRFKCASEKHGPRYVGFDEKEKTLDELLLDIIPDKYGICLEIEVFLEYYMIGLKGLIYFLSQRVNQITAEQTTIKRGQEILNGLHPHWSDTPEHFADWEAKVREGPVNIAKHQAEIQKIDSDSAVYINFAGYLSWYLKCKKPREDVVKGKIRSASLEEQYRADNVAKSVYEAMLERHDAVVAEYEKERGAATDDSVNSQHLKDLVTRLGQLPATGERLQLFGGLLLMRIKDRTLQEHTAGLVQYQI